MNVQNPPRFGGNGAEPRGRKPRRTPKGRQVDPQALDEVRRCSATARASAIC